MAGLCLGREAGRLDGAARRTSPLSSRPQEALVESQILTHEHSDLLGQLLLLPKIVVVEISARTGC